MPVTNTRSWMSVACGGCCSPAVPPGTTATSISAAASRRIRSRWTSRLPTCAARCPRISKTWTTSTCASSRRSSRRGRVAARPRRARRAGGQHHGAPDRRTLGRARHRRLVRRHAASCSRCACRSSRARWTASSRPGTSGSTTAPPTCCAASSPPTSSPRKATTSRRTTCRTAGSSSPRRASASRRPC